MRKEKPRLTSLCCASKLRVAGGSVAEYRLYCFICYCIFMTSPEHGETAEQITFGAVIVSGTYNQGETSLVIAIDGDGASVEAMLFVPDEQRYGVPGSIPITEIDAVVGHQTYLEVVDIMARAINGGEDPDQVVLAQIQELTAKYAPKE